ncbi:hypothetical protein N0V90_009317 [Kalmusia sp. IMI 367209]|nr:hypothetical protein N0V90_009317 [Kalmusia sp. IMI 367209]
MAITILLRLEKFHYRVNFARGILESRNVTYDRTMRKLAKPLPLDTPTTIELAPGNSIQVTLIDANHCIGAVMFLIEGDDKAILYTGDIRAETWWVNSLVQNPILLPYTLGSRRLDCVYLDTTFATKSRPYREFPSKAAGLAELLAKVDAYPDDTIFYFHSWTFGYENVWIALSAYLRSRIHLDDYRTRIYGSLSSLDKKSLREIGLNVQSDNKFLRESTLDDARIVHIIPIITRVDGIEIAELGAGGGKGDLDQKEELEATNAVDIGKILDLCAKSIKDEELLTKVSNLLQQALKEGNGTIDLDMNIQKESQDNNGVLSLQNLVSVLSSHASKSQEPVARLNRTICFPYSRHSSFSELCYLLQNFRPKDVFPCTVDETKWDPELSMRYLFGPFCSGNTFRHDINMMKVYESRLEQETYEKRTREESQRETQSTSVSNRTPIAVKSPILEDDWGTETPLVEQGSNSAGYFTPAEDAPPRRKEVLSNIREGTASAIASVREQHFIGPSRRLLEKKQNIRPTSASVLPPAYDTTASGSGKRLASEVPVTHKAQKRNLTNMQIAYEAALGINLTWADYGGLVSARTEQEEQEL